ncbi:hypothetical protein KQX54_020970 [Cotesia glomerata]|uniref:Uncharacterized protein n=1 Tax=Cotesia glomerata TaxID=32391 RepID=A0AAV7I3E3_COTGL|nr:hypothetical protein KQX54_020970 [Cotesia glomerata]
MTSQRESKRKRAGVSRTEIRQNPPWKVSESSEKRQRTSNPTLSGEVRVKGRRYFSLTVFSPVPRIQLVPSLSSALGFIGCFCR